jgi:hypothetical protein
VVDAVGRPVPGVFCYNNPDVRSLYFGIVEDLVRSYKVDGLFMALFDHFVQYGFQTLTDEMAGALGFTRLPKSEMGLTCFCEHCMNKARDEGLDVQKIRKGLLRGVSLGYIPGKLEKLETPDDVFRFLTQVPEYLDWFLFRSKCHQELQAKIYGFAKLINDRAQVALDIYSVSDSWKYAVDWKAMKTVCDWMKPMFYSGTYPGTSYEPERVYQETLKAIEEVNHEVEIVPGINACAIGANDVEKSIEQALRADADGVIISWDYGLIPLERIEAAGRAIQTYGS